MGILNEIKSGVSHPTPTGGGLLKVAVSVIVVVGLAMVALMLWGKVANKNIPIASAAVAPARVYIS